MVKIQLHFFKKRKKEMDWIGFRFNCLDLDFVDIHGLSHSFLCQVSSVD